MAMGYFIEALYDFSLAIKIEKMKKDEEDDKNADGMFQSN